MRCRAKTYHAKDYFIRLGYGQKQSKSSEKLIKWLKSHQINYWTTEEVKAKKCVELLPSDRHFERAYCSIF